MPNKSFLFYAACFSLSAYGFWPFNDGDQEPFVFAENGQAKAAIVVRTEGRAAGYRYAANELADYLGKMTGARFAVVEQPVDGLATIRVGTAYRAAKTDELHIEVKSSDLLEITGDDALGTLYGVYDLLETFGCRFYCYDFEKIPTTNRLELAADYVRTDAPFMIHRQQLAGVFCENGNPQVNVFSRKHRMTRELEKTNDFAAVRYLGLQQVLCTYYVSRQKFLDEKKHPESYHPEWYALRMDGSRCPHTLCASNDEMYQQLFAEIEKDIVEKGWREISLGDDDAWEMCYCPGCRKITASDDARGNGAQRVALLNRVARHFASRHPGVRFNILVYGHQCPVPAERFRLEPNAGLSFALLWRNHCRPVACCERIGTDVTDWLRLTDKPVEIWDYGCSFFCNAMPFPNHDIYGENFRFYREIGVNGIFSQVQYSTNGDLAELHHYLFSRLCWDPDADDQRLTEEFVKDVYGPVAKEVLEYLEICRHARDRQRWWWGGCYAGATDSWLTAEDCVRIHQLERRMKNRLRREAASPQRIHADRARISMLYLAGSRYDDMMAAAPKMRVKLPPKGELVEEYRQLFEDGLNRLPWYGELGETFYANACIQHMRHIPETASSEPAGKPAFVRVSAEELDGGERRELKREADGTPFVRLDPKPRGTEGRGKLYMDPSKAECGVTAGAARKGTWYIFGTVRSETPAVSEETAAYLGLYLFRPYVLDTHTNFPHDEVVNMYLPGAKDMRDWQTYCMGKYRLYEKSRVWVMCGIINPVESVDVRELVFVNPDCFDDEKNVQTFVGAGQVRASKGGRQLTDGFDKFRYWTLDEAALTNASPSLVCTFTKQQAQAAHVFARVRLGATAPKSAKAGRLVLATPSAKGKPAVEVASVDVSGNPLDDGWQIVSLGCQHIEPGMTLAFMPGEGGKLRFLDLRSVHLLPVEMFAGKGNGGK